jgi:hypothetical protein
MTKKAIGSDSLQDVILYDIHFIYTFFVCKLNCFWNVFSGYVLVLN